MSHSTTPKPPRNRLKDATSPYLLQHASNPVDWYEWGDEALSRAKNEDRPIFLSIGYAACHWCHVMERESFEDEGIAKYMNEHFVNVKVDREERPDVDEIYMSATLALSGSGGWPMSVFLTPELQPFFAGTYFPPHRKYGRPGFRELLESIQDAWKNQRTECVRQAGRLAHAIQRMGSLEGDGTGVLTAEIPANAARQLVSHLDPQEGGFGGAPKFPNPMGILVLLREHRKTGAKDALHAATFTLAKMAAGGIYDQLGGGFHRYSVDDEWLVPHFEKMLYDNAQLTRAYLAAWKVTKDPAWARIVRETQDYVLRELHSPEGGFYSTQDADSEGEEGKFFVWTPEELEHVLGPDDAQVFARAYDVTKHGNFEHKNILHELRPIDDALRAQLAPMKKKLWEVREKRIKPGLDDKVLADWNGYELHALAEAGAALDEPRYLEAAKRCARFWKTEMVQEGGTLLRTWRRGKKHVPALQIDYAALALGLTALHHATLELEWLELADGLAKKMIELFWDEKGKGFFATVANAKDLIARTKSPHDGATPSGNSAAVHALLALHRLTGNEDYRAKAEETMRLFREPMENAPSAVLNVVGAVQEWLEGPPEIALVGPRDAELARMERAIHERFLPGVAISWKPDGDGAGWVKLLEGKSAKDGKATAHVCRSFACDLPVTSADELAKRLDARVS